MDDNIKDIDCFNIRKNYYVADRDGNIYVKETGLKRKTIKNTAGYNLVGLVTEINTMRYYLVHRVILQTFNPIDNPEKFQVNHIRGKDFGDGVDNLEWCTASENMKHAFRTGLSHTLKGEDAVVTNFTNEFVHELCNIMTYAYSFDDILKELQDIGYYIVIFPGDIKKLKNLISTIRLKTAWVQISENYDIIRKKKELYGSFKSKKNIKKVCKLIVKGYSNKEICKIIFNDACQGNMHLINSIRKNRTYRRISKEFW